MGKKFYNPTKGELSPEGLVWEIINYINTEPDKRHKIVIGTDSHPPSHTDDEVHFVTAIVVHRIGAGGRYFWQKNSRNKIFNLRQRIYEEVNLSLITAQEMIGEFRKQVDLASLVSIEPLLTKNLEIHLDVGENGESRDMIKEVVGMVKGNGFNVKTKPEAYGASHVADKHT